jgi:outer membrane lipoprotein carrier protein
MKRLLCYWFILLSFTATQRCLAEDAQDVLSKVKQKYDTLKDAEIKFLQRTTSLTSAGKQSVSGTLYIKKQHKFRVELSSQLIVTDGDTIWSYNPNNRQVIIDTYKKNSRTMTPEKILGAAPTDYSATLLPSEKVGKIQTRVLRLTPKDETSLIATMKLWVDDAWLIRKVELTDLNGRLTTYFVNDIRVNINIPDSRFTYQIPRGVEAVDLR